MSVRVGWHIANRVGTFVVSLFLALSGLVMTRSIIGTEQVVEAGACYQSCPCTTVWCNLCVLKPFQGCGLPNQPPCFPYNFYCMC
jgi:hypothetical protein